MIITDINNFFSFLNPRVINKWFSIENIFKNYFWFISICAILELVIHKGTLFNIGFPLILYAMVIKNFKNNAIILNIIDVFWILDFLWIIGTWFGNDYPHKYSLVYKSTLQELAYMFSYWIVRCNRIGYLQIIVQEAKKPLVIASIVGIYCFFFEPAWYKSLIEHAIETIYNNAYFQKETMLEQYRLRSFFNGPYVLAYFCSITLIYEFILLFATSKRNDFRIKYHIAFIALLSITSLFCMMRAPIASVIVCLVGINIYNFFYGNGVIKNLTSVFVFTVVVLLGYIIIRYVDISTTNFMFNKLEMMTTDEDFFTQRIESLITSISLSGEGFGRFNVVASHMYGMISIPDAEYVKILAEQGYVGLIIMTCMFGIGLIKGLVHSKELFFEVCIIVMLLICMVGANPLSFWDKHCFLYWLALGQISRYNSIYRKK